MTTATITNTERTQAAEIERLNKCILWEQSYMERISTHGPGCFKWGPSNWGCAMHEIERLKGEI